MGSSRWERFRRLVGPDPRGDVEDELTFHLEMRVRELVERGETPQRARELALRRFGDYESSRTACVEIDERRRRHMVRAEHLTELRQDLGYALRMLRRTPAFTAVAVASLALGIGATSAIFSVVQGVLLAPLPYQAADRLHVVETLYPDGTAYPALSAPDFMSIREGSQVFERVEAFTGATLTLIGEGEPRELQGASVTDGLFEMLGLRFAAGRGFVREEFQPGQGRVAILDHGFWQREFGSDATVLGRTLTLGGDAYEIVGVLAPDARIPVPAEMYTPLEYGPTFSATTGTGRRSEFLGVLGRARPGLPDDRIDADLGRIGTLLQSEFPQTNERLTFSASALADLVIGDVRTPLLVLFGAVGFVLLVACANVANLLLARTSARQDELAVRTALGAGRGRLVRQLMTESVVLGAAGGAIGLLIAWWGTRALIAAQPADIPRLDEVGVNGTVVVFTLVVSLVTGLLFGIVPALQATGARLVTALREGGRGALGGAGHRARAGLVVAEMMLAVVLLTGAGLLIRSFIELTRVDPGFQPERAIAFRVTMQGDEYREAQQIRDRVEEVLERLRPLPGVTAVGGTSLLPLSGRGSLWDFQVGDMPPPPNVNAEIGIASVTPEYFRAIGARLVRGRMITGQDGSEAPRVALINEAGARQWFPSEDPVGRRVTTGGAEREIVGVVGDVLQRDPGQPAMAQLYLPYAQRTTRSVRIVVRTAGDPLALAPDVRTVVRSLDPNLPLAELAPLERLVASSMARPRFYTALLSLFAGVALLLASTGIFGVLSYAVAQRTREIGIRMALGASAGGVVRMVVIRALVLAAAGVVLGMFAALALGRVIRSQLFGVSLIDPMTLGVVVLVLGASAMAASWLPARRAAAVQPMTALRE